MANLNFKWGTYDKLQTVTASADTLGTIYFTTDERSMYIDSIVGKNEDSSDKIDRVRIQGSVLYYDSIKDFADNTNPPYSTDTLYFFRKMESGNTEDINAIMAYDGTKWVQINTTEATYQTLVDNLNTLSGDVTTLSGDLTKLTGRVATLEGTVATHTSDIQELYGLVGSEGTGTNSLSTRLKTVEDLAKENSEDIKANAEAISDLQGNVTTLTTNKADTSYVDEKLAEKLDITKYNSEKDSFATNDKLNTELAKKVNQTDYESDQGIINNALTNLESAKANKDEVNTALNKKLDIAEYNSEKASFANAEEVRNGLAGKVDNEQYEADKQTINGSITTLTTNKADTSYVDEKLAEKLDITKYNSEKDSFAKEANVATELAKKVNQTDYDGYVRNTNGTLTDLSNNKADKSAVDSLTSTLTKKIDSDIKAVNALSYQGNIESYDALLSKNEVKIGDMYVAAVDFTIDESTSAAPGDLFIASGEEGDKGYITSTIIWKQVKTGYDELLNPTLQLNNNTISLFNYADSNLGSIEFVTDNTSLAFSSSVKTVEGVVTAQTITLSNVWGTF